MTARRLVVISIIAHAACAQVARSRWTALDVKGR